MRMWRIRGANQPPMPSDEELVCDLLADRFLASCGRRGTGGAGDDDPAAIARAMRKPGTRPRLSSEYIKRNRAAKREIAEMLDGIGPSAAPFNPPPDGASSPAAAPSTRGGVRRETPGRYEADPKGDARRPLLHGLISASRNAK
jgi:hypothetical protein